MSEEAAACSDPEETMEGEELTVQLGGTYPCRTEGGAYRDAEVVKFRMNQRSGREEYYVHYVGLTRRQSEWVDKTCLALSKQVKQDDTENNIDQKLSADDGTTQSPSEEDEPERKKVKVDTSWVVCKDKEVTCMLCNEFSVDHVTKECGHSFCRSCISEDRNNPDVFSCPDCMNAPIEIKSSSKLAPSDTSKATTGGPGTLTKPVKIIKAPPLVNCIDHDEKLKLFCKEDGALGCVICRDSLKHKGHKFLPVPDAVDVYREELSTVVVPLEEALKKTNELTNQQNEKIKQLQGMMTDCQQHITAEFGNLYSFLKGRKEKLLEQLQEQSRSQLEEMETNAAKMVANRDSIKEVIAVANEKVDETDIFYFLDGITELIKTCRDQQKKVASFGDAIIETQLCHADFKGPIQYFAWKQMKSVVPGTELVEESLPPEEKKIENPPAVRPVFRAADHFKAPTPTPKPAAKPMPAPPKPVIKNISSPATQSPEAKLIWMVGNLFMNKVQDRAKSSSVGPNLGFDEKTYKVNWLITPRASDVKLCNTKQKVQPDIIFIYIDHNFYKTWPKLKNRTTKLIHAAERFLGTVLILSTSLPTRETWEKGQNNRRIIFNNCLKEYGKPKTFQLVEHNELEKKLLMRYKANDLRSYTDDEMDLFLTDVRYALQKAMGQKLETPPSVDSQNNVAVKEPQPASPGKPAEPATKVTGNDQQKTPLMKVDAAENGKQPTTLEKKEAVGTSKPSTANSSIAGNDQQKTPLKRVEAAENGKQPTSLEKKEAPGTSKPSTANSFNHFKAPTPTPEPAPTPVIKNISSPVTQSPGGKVILMLGNLFMNKVQDRAKSSSVGPNLGFDDKTCKVHWLITPHASEVNSQLQKAKHEVQPDIIFIHIDVQFKKTWPVLRKGITKLKHAVKIFPGKVVILSLPLPTPGQMQENRRRSFNFKFVERRKDKTFQLAKHNKLEKKLLMRYKAKDLHSYTDDEMDLFLTDVQYALQKAMCQKLETPPSVDSQNKAVVKEPQPAAAGKPVEPAGKGTELVEESLPPEEKKIENPPAVRPVFRAADHFKAPTSTPKPAAKPMPAPTPEPGAKVILMVGNLFMYQVQDRAKSSSLGPNLDFDEKNCKVHWLITADASEVNFQLLKAKRELQPDIIFIHIDLNFNKTWRTFRNVIHAAKLSPGKVVIMSLSLPTHDIWSIGQDNWRIKNNSWLMQRAEHKNFQLAKHVDLEKKLLMRYKANDLRSYTDDEMDLFLTDVRYALQKAMGQKLETPPSVDSQNNAPVKEPQPALPRMPAEPAAKVTGNDQQKTPLKKVEATENVKQATTQEKKEAPGTSKPSAANSSITGNDQQKKVEASENVKQPTTLEKKEAPGTSKPSAANSSRKDVWLIGKPYVEKAALVADKKSYTNLGFDKEQWKVHWLGRIDQWSKVIHEMNHLIRNLGRPSIVFLHVGSYDLEIVGYEPLVENVMSVIRQLASLYPKIQFIFSTVLPRPEWLSSGVEDTRKRFNYYIGDFAKKCGFELATNSKLEQILLHMFHGFRTTPLLNINENSVFIESIKYHVEQAMLKLDKPTIEIQEPQKKVVVSSGTAPAASTEDKNATEQKMTLECHQPVTSKKKPGDQPVTKEKKPGDQSVTHEKTEGKQPVMTAKSEGKQPVMTEKAQGHQAVANKKTEGNWPEMSEKTQQISNNHPASLLKGSGLKYIWIIGNAYICKAAQKAIISSVGVNLGFKKWIVHWMGRVGMNWSSLLSEMDNALSTLVMPSIVFIHLGDFDVGNMPYEALTKTIEDDLSQITAKFNKTEFIFSTLLPNAQSLTNSNEQSRKDFNNALTRYAEELGFHVSTHKDIEESVIKRFKTGGSNVISDSEYDMFVTNIKSALEVVVRRLERQQNA